MYYRHLVQSIQGSNGPSKIWKAAFKIWSDMVSLDKQLSPQIFQRLSSTNFTSSILEYFVSFSPILAAII